MSLPLTQNPLQALIFTFLSVMGGLHAQNTPVFAPIGAVWHYNSYTNFHGNAPFYFKFTVEKDTLILGQNAKLLRYSIFQNDTFRTDPNLNKYIITSGQKVFYKVEDAFVLLYDFGAAVGDTIHSRVEDYPVEMGCFGDFENGPIDYSYVIDSIGSMDINGILLRTQFVTVVDPPGLQPSWYFRGPIIERIGQIVNGGYWWGSGEACILEDNGFLRCYIDPDVTYSDPYFSDHHECDYTEIREAENKVARTIYPNPVDDRIYLNEKADLITIYNASGQKIRSFINQDQTDISELQSGIYFLQYQYGNIRHIEKFLKL